jgi:hypothetical protein
MENKGLKKTQKKEELIELINPYAEFDVAPKKGYINGSCQTEIYKEILTMKVKTENQSLQTDSLLNRPNQKEFFELKNGVSTGTQI